MMATHDGQVSTPQHVLRGLVLTAREARRQLVEHTRGCNPCARAAGEFGDVPARPACADGEALLQRLEQAQLAA